MKTTTSLLLGCLAMAALATSSAWASTVSLPPGAVRDITLSRPIPLTFRLSNTGDCTIGLVGKDANGHEILNGVIRPGEVQDFETLSAKLASVTAIVQREGSTGAIIRSSPLSNAQEMRVPAGTGFLPCQTLPSGIRIYTAGDGEASRFVTYHFRYGSDCQNGTIQINVTSRPGGQGGGQINPINPELTITSDKIEHIDVTSSSAGTPNLSFFYTRNP